MVKICHLFVLTAAAHASEDGEAMLQVGKHSLALAQTDATVHASRQQQALQMDVKALSERTAVDTDAIGQEYKNSYGIVLSPDVVAVVNNFNHNVPLDWLTGIPSVDSPRVTEVGVDVESSPSHDIAESWPWVAWIVANYKTLPDFVAFLHGDPKSWHSTIHPKELTTLQPRDVHMLSYWCLKNSEDEPGSEPLGGNQSYWVEMLYQNFWNITFADAWREWQMERTHHCCSECLVSRAAIQLVPKDVWVSLDKLMHNRSDEQWGYIMERLWQNLFSQRMVLESRVIQNNLEKLHTAPVQPFSIKLDLDECL